VPVEAHKSNTLTVDDEGTDVSSWTLNPDGSWANTGDGNQAKDLEALMAEVPAIADALRPILELQRKLYEIGVHLKQLDEKANTLTADEARARENLTALKGNDAGKRFVDELNHAEDELEATRKQTASVTETKKTTIEALKKALETLDIHWSSPAKS
jgi:chromosome segregation ATPase